MKKYDLLAIGGGTAGMNLVYPLAAKGWKTAVVEEKHLGGTCINVGCIPSKTLISSARVMQTVRDAGSFGVIAAPPRADWAAMVERKDRLVGRIRSRSYKNVEKNENIDLYQGRAVFSGPRELEVNGEVLAAEKIVIAAGAHTAIPPLPGLNDVDYLTSTTAMTLESLPESLLILGGGIIALEFSQLFARLGVKVTILQRGDSLAPNLEPEISAEIRRILEAEGVEVKTDTNIASVGMEKGLVYAEDSAGANPVRYRANRILVAVGRAPNSDQLALDKAGIDTDGRGYITVDRQFKTKAEGIWAVGDIIGGMMFTHKAWHDAYLLSRNLLEGRDIDSGDRLVPFAVFTEPEIAGVGLGEKAASEAGHNVRVQSFPFSFQGRARAAGKLDGFIKLVVDQKNDVILGAHMIGPEAGELIHELITAMRFGATVIDIGEMIHVHPTLSEAINNTAWSRP